jgi:hypothetical protein
MPYIKSTFVGLFTFVIATIAYVLIATAVFLRRHPVSPGTVGIRYFPARKLDVFLRRVPPGTEVGFDLRALVANPIYWLIAIAAFALGFYWQFRRT